MPIWVWILIIFLGYDDVYTILKGHWYLPVIIILSIYGVLKATGTTHLPEQIYSIAKNAIKIKFNSNNKYINHN